MCGIVGAYNSTGLDLNIPYLIEAMTNDIKHRGPDAQGSYIDNNAAFGHARLTIVDLSTAGNQPLFNEDGSICLVFNGEIYNYRKLRTELKNKGHKFSSTSDSEVIIHLYEEHSFDCLQYIEGMFAFALYDKKLKRIFIARDRVGEKPLYYTWQDDTFYFASELKSLKSIPELNFELSEDAMVAYFSNTQVPAPYSMFKGIYKLIPGHFGIVKDRNIRIDKYWKIDYTNKSVDSESSLVDSMDQKLNSVIKDTMDIDVEPLGLTLSGGLDSSMVLAMMHELSDSDHQTFTLGKKDKDLYDLEIERARRMSNTFGVANSVLALNDITFEDCLEVLSKFCEPVGIFDIFHMYYLKKYMHDKVKVVLSGNGADEVLGGYSSYINVLEKHNKISCEPTTEDKNVLMNKLIESDYNSDIQKNSEMLFSQYMQEYSLDFDPMDFLKYYFEMSSYDNFLDARLFIDLMIAVNHSASLMDVIGMSHSIEVRSPFLHPKIIEFSASLPLNLKVKIDEHGACNKYILKQLAKKYLPEDLIFVDKLTCGQFIDYKAKLQGPWRLEVEDVLFVHGAKLSKYFCAAKLRSLWDKYISNQTSTLEDQNLRKTFIFMLWHKAQDNLHFAHAA